MFGLKDNYLEADLEKAILTEIEAFILEFGHGFSFVERQKRMIVDGEDIVLDLLFFHRKLKRLRQVSLEFQRFQAIIFSYARMSDKDIWYNWEG